MKKRFLRIMCVLLLCCSFGLTGCLGASDGSNSDITPPSGDLTGIVENAEDITATKDNVTYYYESLESLAADAGKDPNDRNNLRHTFGDAYVFVDPGSDYEITDHYTGMTYQFYKLVGRQIQLMADILYTAINRIYIDGTIPDGTTLPDGETLTHSAKQYVFGSDDDLLYNTIKLEHKSNSLSVLDVEPPEDIGENIDLNHPYTFSVFAGLDSNSEWKTTINETFANTLEEDNVSTPKDDTLPLEINTHIFNLAYAILGGYQINDQNYILLNDGTRKYYAEFYNDPTLESHFNFDEFSENRWKTVGAGTSWDSNIITSVQNSLKENLKMCIASALSGVETNGIYNEKEYGEMLKRIDHLGFTATDKENVKTQILDNIIGTKVVKKDDSYLNDIRSYVEFEILNQTKIVINQAAFNELFYQGGATITPFEWQNYKGYRVVIDAIVEQAMTINKDNNITGLLEETLLPDLPRVEIVKMDSWNLMDDPNTGEEEEEVDDEEIDPDDIPTDVESIEFKEKFGKFYKIVGILFMPKQVYGERTMAIKENDQWVRDDDGNPKLKTFTVEGFVLTGSDLVMLSEEDKMVTYQTNFNVHTATKDMNISGDVSTAGYVKPDPSEQATYYTSSTLDIDKQEIIQKEESEIGEYRIQGYNGLAITDEARVVNSKSEDQLVEGLIAKTENGITTITMNTIMYQYIGAGDVNGDAGTTHAGCVLDLSNFAGDNYVVVNFPILAVNDDTEDRDANMNILYFYLDCI